MYQCREGASLPSPECEMAVLRTLLERLAALPEVQARWRAAGGSNSEGRGGVALAEGGEGKHGLGEGGGNAWAEEGGTGSTGCLGAGGSAEAARVPELPVPCCGSRLCVLQVYDVLCMLCYGTRLLAVVPALVLVLAQPDSLSACPSPWTQVLQAWG